MTDVLQFMSSVATYLTTVESDWYETYSEALEVVDDVMETLRVNKESPFEQMYFGGHSIVRIFDSGIEEFLFSKKLAVLEVFDDGVSVAHSYDTKLVEGLPHISEMYDDEDDS